MNEEYILQAMWLAWGMVACQTARNQGIDLLTAAVHVQPDWQILEELDCDSAAIAVVAA